MKLWSSQKLRSRECIHPLKQNHLEESRERTTEVDILVQDVRENVEAPSNLCRQRRSPKRYTSYMALMTELVEIEPSSFKESVEKPI